MRLMKKTMVAAVSVRVRDFAISLEMATEIPEPTTRIEPKLISVNPGRRITSIPKNPMATATQRGCRDGSPINRIAPTEA